MSSFPTLSYEATVSPLLVTEEELLAIAKKIKNTKTPGIDIRSIDFKIHSVRKVYNAYIMENGWYFPTRGRF